MPNKLNDGRIPKLLRFRNRQQYRDISKAARIVEAARRAEPGYKRERSEPCGMTRFILDAAHAEAKRVLQ